MERVLHEKICKRKKVQYEKSATRKRCNTKIMKHKKRVQDKKRITRAEKVQSKKRPTRKVRNMDHVQHEKSVALKSAT